MRVRRKLTRTGGAAGTIVVVGVLTMGVGWAADVAVHGSAAWKKGPSPTTTVPNNVVDDGDNQHPSGKDRSVEHGGSGNQGTSQSDPDGEANGGPDKPGGAGGVDLADQDGNNGCGNDDDFEDDNNGNCGGQRSAYDGEKAPKVGKTDKGD